MDKLRNFNFRLGIPQLLPEWKSLFSPKHLGADLVAGISVAFVAIPLSLAIALASGVPPAAGLVTAIVAGIVCALFAGAPLTVSGPAAAMSVLLADIIENYGLKALVVMGLMTGIMQLLSGVFGLGKLGRYVPLPVIAGFTAGIGVIIIIGQLPRALGMLPPPESHVSDVILHIRQFQNINFTCLAIAIGTLLAIRLLPKINARLPAILLAVIAATALVYVFNLTSVPLIGTIPNALPVPSLPMVSGIPMGELFLNAFAVYLLASLETLLSASAIDKLTFGKKHDSDQELIGQGLGNIAVSLFGGIPVTGVIARSITNIRAGAKTRRASIIHSLIILLAVYVISPWISSIPIAALAGVLFSVALSMVNYREFHGLLKISHAEALIYAVTFFTLVFVDLIAGVQAGIVAAGLIVLFKAAKTNLYISTTAQDDTVRLSLTGSLTFLSTKEHHPDRDNLNHPCQTIAPAIIFVSPLYNL